MKSLRWMLMLAGALCASLAGGAALAAENKVVIGDIDDMSGPYADVIGAAGIEVRSKWRSPILADRCLASRSRS